MAFIKHSQLKVVYLVLFLSLALLSVIGVNLFINNKSSTDNRSKAVNSSNYASQKPTHQKGQVIIRLKPEYQEELKSIKHSDGSLLIDKLSQGFVTEAELDNSRIPSSFQTLRKRYKLTAATKLVRKTNKDTDKNNVSSAKDLEKHDQLLKRFDRTYLIFFDESIAVEHILHTLKTEPDLEFAEPNYSVHTSSTVNDPYFQDTYGTNISNRDPNWNPAYDYQWGLKKIDANTAWDHQIENIVPIAVIDTGVDFTHQDLGSCTLNQLNAGECLTLEAGYNFLTNSTNVTDDHGHGTHVTGVIRAISNNGLGVAAINRSGKIMPLKALDSSGNGSIDNSARAIIYASDNGAKVINMSFGMGPLQTIPVILDDAINYATNLGVNLIAAAGNENYDLQYGFWPASHPLVIAVGAIDSDDSKAPFSNFGSGLTVAAPGIDILSLRALNTDMGCPRSCNTNIVGTNYFRANGTSMAAPHVSALAGAIISKHTDLVMNNPEKVRAIIANTATDIGISGYDSYSGFGRINASRALTQPDTTQLPVAIIRSPNTGSVNARQNISIIGTATAANFRRYTLSYSSVTLPETIHLISESTAPIINDALGQWQLNEDGTFNLNLTLYFEQNGVEKSISSTNIISVDSFIRPGWPITLPNPHYAYHEPTQISADINFDGVDEIVVNYANTLYVISASGEIIWSKRVHNSDYDINYALPVVGDIDPLYPGKEILSYTATLQSPSSVATYRLMAWHADGTNVPGWPTAIIGLPYISTSVFSGPTIIKTDNGLVVGVNEYNLGRSRIFSGNGSELKIIQTGINTRPIGQIIATDLIGDSNEEIIIYLDNLNTGPELRAYSVQGDSLWSVPIRLSQGGVDISYVVGDIAGDSKSEVIMLGEVRASTGGSLISMYLSIYNQNGITLPGWDRRDVTNQFSPYHSGVNSQIELADLDRDLVPEIVVKSFNVESWGADYYYRAAFKLDGTILRGLPTKNDPPMMLNGYVIGERNDGNGISKIIYGSGLQNKNGIYYGAMTASQYLGDQLINVPGFPKTFCQDCDTDWGVLASFEPNGNKTYLATVFKYPVYSLVAMDIPNSQTEYSDWPMFRGNERNTTSYTRRKTPIPQVSIIQPTATPRPETCPQPQPNYNEYYGYVTFLGSPVSPGIQIKAYSPRNHLVGCQTTAVDGVMPFIRVYGSSPNFQGMEINEPVTFKVNEQVLISDPSTVIWSGNGTNRQVNLSLPTPTPTPPNFPDADRDNDLDYSDLLTLIVHPDWSIFNFNAWINLLISE